MMGLLLFHPLKQCMFRKGGFFMSGERVLIIEDDTDIAHLMGRYLMLDGFQVEIALDGEKGLLIARDHSPDLVILDIRLPKLDGLEVLRRLRATNKEVLVLILSAVDSVNEKVIGLEAGADDYLVKPIYFEELGARIHALLRRRRIQPEALHSVTRKAKSDTQTINLPQRYFNPYIVGKHVSGDNFIGRQNILTELITALKAGNHLLIEGERRIGKTSLLHRLAELLRNDDDYYFIPAYVQLQRVREERLFYAMMRALARESRRRYNQLPRLLCEARGKRYDSFDAEDDLHQIVSSFQERTDLPLRVVILLDEGDRLREFSENAHRELRGWMGADQQDVLLVVWCGVAFDKAWHQKTSPWYNQFRSSVELPALSFEAARELITCPVEGYYTYEEEATRQILALSQGKPFIIQLICDECVKLIWRQKSGALITLANVTEVWPLVQARLNSDAKAEVIDD